MIELFFKPIRVSTSAIISFVFVLIVNFTAATVEAVSMDLEESQLLERD